MKAIDIKIFSKTMVLPRLGAGHLVYANRDLVRMRGPFAQLLIFTTTKPRWLRVIPTFYVVGADAADDDRPHQTVSLEVLDPQRWQFPPQTALDADFAKRLCGQIEKDSGISFVAPLDDDQKICAGLQPFINRKTHWAAPLFRAFFNICRGAQSARTDLAQARQIFLARSRYGSGKPLLDYEQALLSRFDALEARLDMSDCIAICRAEADEHAKRMSLPTISWPPEWPTAGLPRQRSAS